MATKSKGPASDGTPAAEPSHQEPQSPKPTPQKIGGVPPNIANQFASKAGKHLSQTKGGNRNFRHQGR